MPAASYTLDELSKATAIESRTIRSYIERGLLPGADSRGRGATYSAGHLARLKVIKALRRARPNVGLSEIRISLQQMTPEQIERLSQGSIGAVVQGTQADHTTGIPPNGDPEHIDWDEASVVLTGVERLVAVLRDVTSLRSPTPRSKSEEWLRISITPDIELSVRGGFDEARVATFRDLADLLRHVLEQQDAIRREGEG